MSKAKDHEMPQSPTGAREEPLTPQRIRQDAFLAALSRCPVITRAAQQVGIGREVHYDWLHGDPTYRPRYEAAMIAAGDALEEKAMEWALDGWLEPVFHEGKIVGHIQKIDTRHTRDMLRAAKPEKYRQRHELTGKDGKPLFDLDAIRAWMSGEPGDDDK